MSAEGDIEQKATEAAGAVPEQHPLAAVFPGESIFLTNGRHVVIKPWGMKALTQEVPALVGKVLAKMGPLYEVFQAGALGGELVPTLMESLGEEISSLAAWSAGISAEEFEALSATDGLKIIRAVIRQNQSFFVELAGLRQDLNLELPGASGQS